MDYLAWSRVIQELEDIIQSKKVEVAVNTAFLIQAKIERAKYPEPKKPKNDTASPSSPTQ